MMEGKYSSKNPTVSAYKQTSQDEPEATIASVHYARSRQNPRSQKKTCPNSAIGSDQPRKVAP